MTSIVYFNSTTEPKQPRMNLYTADSRKSAKKCAHSFSFLHTFCAKSVVLRTFWCSFENRWKTHFCADQFFGCLGSVARIEMRKTSYFESPRSSQTAIPRFLCAFARNQTYAPDSSMQRGRERERERERDREIAITSPHTQPSPAISDILDCAVFSGRLIFATTSADALGRNSGKSQYW